jgi:iron complex transport system permease protein
MITTDSYFSAQAKKIRRYQWIFGALLLFFAVVALGFGPAGWDWRLSVAWLYPEYFSQFSELQINVVSQIRLPRFVLAILVGAILAQTGAATQALCRNPLADPSIIGISGGAAVMAVAVIALAPKLGFNADVYLPYAAFIGALLVTLAVYKFAKRNNEINVTTLILVGVAFNALSFALIGLLSFYADDTSLRLINYWTMGSLGGASWSGIAQALPLFLVSFFGLYWKRKELLS